MEIPKYVEKMIDKRAWLAADFLRIDMDLQAWLNKNDILVSDDDINTGACSICEPFSSAEHIKDAIRQKGTRKIQKK